MKLRAECVPCLLRRTLHEARMVDPSKEEEVMASALKIITTAFPERPVSVDLATRVHMSTYAILGTDDPYLKFKRRSTDVAMSLLPRAQEILESSDDRLRDAALLSIVGNVLDFGIRGGLDDPETLESGFERLFAEGLHVNHLPDMIPFLKGRVAYFADNCGEILFDALLVREIKALGGEIGFVVKNGPILSDATLQDALSAGIDTIADVLFTTGTRHVGFHPSMLPDELLEFIGSSDIIISKGMANYEAFTETDYRPIGYLMRTKCRPVAEHAHLPEDKNVAFLVR